MTHVLLILAVAAGCASAALYVAGRPASRDGGVRTARRSVRSRVMLASLAGASLLLALGALATTADTRRLVNLSATDAATVAPSSPTAYGKAHPGVRTEVATFAAGCFWGTEQAFRGVDGVTRTVVGYCGGAAPEPGRTLTHDDISRGRTGHAEAVRVEYDPARVSYRELLDVFWDSHDPTRFAPDPDGEEWPARSEIFVHSPEQREAAVVSKARLDASGRYRTPVPTRVTFAPDFFTAEPEHQQFVEKRGGAAGCGTRRRNVGPALESVHTNTPKPSTSAPTS